MTDRKSVLSKKVSGRRRAVAESDDSSTDCDKELLLPANPTHFCKNCCSCTSRSFKPKSREKLSVSDAQFTRISYRESLETKVLNEQVSQQVSSDQWRQLENQLNHLNEASTVLNTLFSSIHVTSTCLLRLLKLISENNSEVDEKCEDICERINEALELLRENPVDRINVETSDFLLKKSDLHKASTNFADILRRSSVPSNRQLSKLEKQFDEIRSQFLDSKSKAVMKINEIIKKKSDFLSDNMKTLLIPILNNSTDLEKKIINNLNVINSDFIRKKLESNRSLTSFSLNKFSVFQTDSSNITVGDTSRKVCTCCESSN